MENIETRIQKIENFLMYDGGSWYTDMIYQIVKLAVTLVLGYIFINVITNATAQMLIQQLPDWCKTYGNV